MASKQNSSSSRNKGSVMTRRTFVTFFTASVLTGVFLFYNVLITPLAKPPVFKRKKGSTKTQEKYFQPTIYKDMAKKHLPQYKWIEKASYFAKTKTSYIYSRETTIKGSELALKPFAMVMLRPDKNGVEQAYTIQCPNAIIEFQNKIDPKTKVDLGRIIKGKFVGDVEIIGPDNLIINGRNFTYDEGAKKIYSDSLIEFFYKTHHGTATGMDIELVNDKSQSDIEQLAFNHANRIILRKNVRITMKEDNEEKLKANKPVEIVFVQSAGNFTFEIEKMIATFDKKVRILHPDLKTPNQIDKLLCDHLTMTLDESLKEGQKKEKKKPKKAKASMQDDISIKKMVATGKQVKLISTANQFDSIMNKLVYDRSTRFITMTSAKKVEINRDGNIIHSPVIKIKHTEDNRITHTWCQGEGDMKYLNEEDGKIVFSANWKKELSIMPDTNPSSGLDLITFKEKAQIKQPLNNTGLAADTIYVYVKRNEEEKKKKAAKKKKVKSDSASENFEIKRMLALGNVVMTDPQMDAKTKELRVYFEEDKSPKKSPQQQPGLNKPVKQTAKADQNIKQVQFEKTSSKQPGKKLANWNNEISIDSDPAKNNPEKEILFNNQNSSEKNQAKTDKNKKPKDGPAIIEANKIRVRILVSKDKKAKTSSTAMNAGSNKMSEVFATGNVHVSQKHLNGDEPMEILCDALHIKDESNILHIYGVAERVENKYLKGDRKTEHPADIRDRGLHISGRVIHMDRKNNYAEVEGAGLLELPVTETMDGKKLDTPQLLDIWWDEKMTFDGKTANFYGNVRSEMDTSRITCEEMKVVLKEKISFAEMDEAIQPGKIKTNSKKEKTDIETLDCFGNVSFRSKSYKEDLLVEDRIGSFAEFHMVRETGKTIAQGPGIIKSWQRGNSMQFGQKKKGEEKKNAVKKKESDKKWRYTRILFYDKSKGNMDNKEMTFTGRINIVTGPVKRVREELDPDYLPDDAALMRCETLQLVHHPSVIKDEDGHIEMIASDNAILESGKYQIWADKITHDQSQDLYIARSLGKQQASVWQASKTGGEGSSVRAQTIKLIPSLNSLKLDKATSIEGSFLGD
jgi:hypothetical protein